MSGKKIYKKRYWSWFYKKFIKGTVNDNFYTPAEIMEKNREIIQRADKFNIEKKISRPDAEEHD